MKARFSGTLQLTLNFSTLDAYYEVAVARRRAVDRQARQEGVVER